MIRVKTVHSTTNYSMKSNGGEMHSFDLQLSAETLKNRYEFMVASLNRRAIVSDYVTRYG